MLDLVLLNVVFIVLPIVVYLLYIVYDNVIDHKGKDLFFSLSIFTSIYLITKYSLYFEYTTDIIKILLLICLLKNKIKLSVIVSLFISVYFSYIKSVNVIDKILYSIIDFCIIIY